MAHDAKALPGMEELEAEARELEAQGKLTGPTLAEFNKRINNARTRAAQIASIRNIGVIPPIVDVKRRNDAARSLIEFGVTYYGDQMWRLSPAHRRMISRVERVCLQGGRVIYALPRGFGKSVWARIAVVWGVVTGIKDCIPLLSANAQHAARNYDGVKALLESPILAEDYPEIVFPIQKLEGITIRGKAQMYETKEGVPEYTHMEYGSKHIALPCTDGAWDVEGDFHENKAKGSVILSQGLFSAVRGMSFTTHDGRILRPDFAVLDDPQDEESAVSFQQIEKRLQVIKSGLGGSGGHEEGIGIVIPATVIAPDDLVDQLLDDPSWMGERVPFFVELPTKLDDLWLGEYRKIRQEFNKTDPDSFYAARKASTEYYKENRAVMDAGAEVTWEECYAPVLDEISAIQHGINALIDMGPAYFYAELQNEPHQQNSGEGLTLEILESSITPSLPFGVVPSTSDCLTAAVDVHDDILFYVVTAWNKATFSGHIVEFGTLPDQRVPVFTQGNAIRSMQDVYRRVQKEAAIRAGLDTTLQYLRDKLYTAQDGSKRSIDRVLVDSGYLPETVFQATLDMEARWAQPSRGEYYGVKKKEFNEVTRERKSRAKNNILSYGEGWRATRLDKYQALQRVYYDSNFWKTFIRDRFTTPKGADGHLSTCAFQTIHRLFFAHMLAERSVMVEAVGRKVEEWENTRLQDNHWFDCLCYSAVAASMQGAHIAGVEIVQVKGKNTRPRRKIGY